MSARDQANSDPLPYVQVDRAAMPLATHLASFLGCTFQHALGSVVAWWFAVEPRKLERIIAETPAGEAPEFLLSGAEFKLLFKIASTYDVDPQVMTAIGFLEERGDDRWRVRGMSRQFAPIERRITKRMAGAKGGKASVETRRSASGTAQPQAETEKKGASGAALAPAQAPTEALTEAPPKQARSTDRSSGEAPPNTAVSGQRSSIEDLCFTSQALCAPSQEVQKTNRVSSDDDDAQRIDALARSFVAWASTQAPPLEKPGPQVFEWARAFFAKFDPYDGDERLKLAFVKWLTWCSLESRVPGWGLWLSEKVWTSRWDEVRAQRPERRAS